MASDALDEDLSQTLGPAPEPQPSREAGPAPRRSHHKAVASPSRQAVGAADLVKPLEGSLGLLTFIAGLLLCGFRLEDPLVDHITMDASEAEAIAKPLANILARQKWFRQYGRQFLNSEDYIGLIFALCLYAGRVVPPVQARLSERPKRERATEAARVSAGVAGNPSANGHSGGAPYGLSGAYAVD